MCTSCPTTPTKADYSIPECRVEVVRPTFEEIFMGLAHDMRLRSTCHRMRVGAVVCSTNFRQVYAVGYNGRASGLDNGCKSTQTGSCGCRHAEENAAISNRAPYETDKFVFCTHLPCADCAERIIQMGNVKRVYYAEEYRLTEGLDIFDEVGIEHYYLPVADNKDKLAIFKAAEDFYKIMVVDADQETTLIGTDKPFATPYSWQMHMVLKWRDAVTSKMVDAFDKQSGKPYIKELAAKIRHRINIDGAS